MGWLLSILMLLGAEKRPDPTPWRTQADAMLKAPACLSKARRCVPIDLHLLEVQGRAVRDATWWQAQVEVARRLFAPVGVDFYLRSVSALDAAKAEVLTRTHRDAFLGQAKAKNGIDVFLVRSLADVDKAGAFIRGVHWRRRDDLSKRWVILSSIAEPEVMAHEFGHFFGLPHSRYKVSIMNKSPRKSPPWSARVFAAPELKKIARHRDQMLKSGRLIAKPVTR